MANPIDETGAMYISKLSLNGTAYTIKDAWVRAEVEEVKSAIAGGTHFIGVTTTELTDGATTNPVTIGGESVTAVQGDIVLFAVANGEGTINKEFIFDGTKWQEFGSQGLLKALAYKDSASGSASVPIASAITFNDYTPSVDKGTLAVTTATGTLAVTTTEDTATGTFSPAAITIAASTVTLTPTTGTFTALTDVTYTEATATLSISATTSSSFWTGATGEAAGQTVTPTADQSISVSYQKATATSGTFLTTASLTGDLAVTAVAPTATITDPTITVTVS